jgi:outer membrane receptor protein involved in Fe transport
MKGEFLMKKTNLLGYAALSSLTLALASTPSYAQVDEIIVTATKRAASTQDIPVAVTALGEQTLEENNIDVFSDYLLQLPNVNAAAPGPGQGTIFIRGISASAANTTTGVAAGLAPNVALYLDEQPVTQVGRNLDIYAVDLNRVEVLPGPQGTLFGASAQAGVVRLITNKPKLGVEEVKYSFGVSFTEGGDESFKGEATYNFPVGDSLAIRATVFGDRQGGYIDNVPGVADIRNNIAFTPEGTVLANGQVLSTPPQGSRFGLQPGDPGFFAGLNGGRADNSQFVEDNFNDASYTGFRVGALYEINDDWRLTVQNHTQFTKADGVFFADPEIDSDLRSIQRYAEDRLDDEIYNTAWTLEGRLGMLEAVYTGAFNRHTFEQRADYSDYSFIGPFIPYYTCNYYNVYYAGGNPGPTGECNDPRLFADIDNRTDTSTHELRFNTPEDKRIRATFGAYYSDQENEEQVDFTYPGSQPNFGGNATPGFLGFQFPNAPISSSTRINPDPRDPGVIFVNDITRTDEQLGFFAEATYDLIPDTLSVTGGLRYYDVRVDFLGSSNNISNGGGGNTGDLDQGFDLDDIFDGNATFLNYQGGGNARAGGVATQLPFDPIDKAVSDGVIFKGNVTWTPDDEKLFYLTYSEGFRPGVLNRPAAVAPLVQPFVDTDELTNYEFGWKTRFAGNTIQFNGSAFWVTIDGLQTSVFDPVTLGTNLFVGSNAADARVRGVEADVVWAPAEIEGLTVNGAISLLDAEVTEVLLGADGGTPSITIAQPGEKLAFAPSFQGNIRARYEWPEKANGMAPYMQANASVSTSSFSDLTLINRAEQEGYFLVGSAVGFKKDNWGLEAYVENLTDERAQITNTFVYNRERISINRPRTWGMRFSYKFDE